MKNQWFATLVLCGALLAGCGPPVSAVLGCTKDNEPLTHGAVGHEDAGSDPVGPPVKS